MFSSPFLSSSSSCPTGTQVGEAYGPFALGLWRDAGRLDRQGTSVGREQLVAQVGTGGGTVGVGMAYSWELTER